MFFPDFAAVFFAASKSVFHAEPHEVRTIDASASEKTAAVEIKWFRFIQFSLFEILYACAENVLAGAFILFVDAKVCDVLDEVKA